MAGRTMAWRCLIVSALLVEFVQAGATSSTTPKPWKYDGEGGPDQWHQHNEDCAGHYQSPIALWDEDVIVDNTLPTFELIGYEKNLHGLQLENNGHTVKLEINPVMYGLRIRGGGLPNDSYYRLAQVHFHWGAEDSTGSEHMLGNHYYPFEMHLVHIKEPLTLGQALKDPQGLAVLAVFFEHSDVDNNTALMPLIEVIDRVQDKGGKVLIHKPFKARDLLPSDVSNFFRYQGSLTTPPCSEVVTWTVFVQPHPITTLQIEKFRSVRKTDHVPLDVDEPDLEDKLLFNHRPVQPLHERKVLVRKQLKYALPHKSAANNYSAPHLVSLASIVLGLLCLQRFPSH